MLDATEKFMGELARPGREQPHRRIAVVEVLVRGHRRKTDDIAGFPGVFSLLVYVVAFAFLDENHFFEDMPVLARVAAGLDLHRHEIQSPSRHFGPQADVKL